jgi:hypothetical protein
MNVNTSPKTGMRSPRLEEDGTYRIAKPKTLHANHLIAIAATSSRFHQDSGKREGCTLSIPDQGVATGETSQWLVVGRSMQ